MAAKKFKGSPMDRAVAAAFMSNTPVYLQGTPGVGKSAYLIGLAEMLGAHIEVMLASIRESQDFLGLPIERNGEVDYVPGAWVNRLNTKGMSCAKTELEKAVSAAAKYSMLFLDETTTVDESTMKGLLRVVNERWVGEVPLEDYVRIVLAGNDPDDAVDGIDLPAAMANRMIHLDFKFDSERWAQGLQYGWETIKLPPLATLVYGLPENRRPAVAAAVVQYTRTEGVEKALTAGVPSDPTKAGQAWASPRTWTMLSNVLSYVHPDDRAVIEMLSRGLVGDELGLKFATFLKNNDLIDPMAVIKGELKVDFKKTRKDHLWMLCNGIASIGKDQKELRLKALDVLLDCALAEAPDIAQNGVQILTSMGRIPEELGEKFQRAYRDMLNYSDFRVVDAVSN